MNHFKELVKKESFLKRHIGPSSADVASMLDTLGFDSLDDFTDHVVPDEIKVDRPLQLPAPLSECEAISKIREISKKNEVYKSHIGMGYYPTILPPVIQRNILENPAWYTAYTPYQPEISQGRLEALFNFQTVITDLTGMDISNASLLDEATAAAEAIALASRVNKKNKSNRFLVADTCHPQTIEVIRTRSVRLGFVVEVVDLLNTELTDIAGVVVSYPNTNGIVEDYRALSEKVHKENAQVICVADLLALTLFTPPGEWGADIVVGSSQRFGVPVGFGGPHAAFLATRNDYQRQIPGRIVGQSHDVDGKVAWRLALQTREQHIRRQKATSNICTSQVLLANMASMYAVYHGPQGLKKIAQRIHLLTSLLRAGLKPLGLTCMEGDLFDTVKVHLKRGVDNVVQRAQKAKRNFRIYDEHHVGVSFDETTTVEDLLDIIDIFANTPETTTFDSLLKLVGSKTSLFENKELERTSAFLTQKVFHSYHSETEMLRYISKLQRKDYSLANGMIPLGSCTMKLNATSEMLALSWEHFADIHPFAPKEQTKGYLELFEQLESMLSEITGLDATSLQPNSGAQGEYSGMLAIRRYLDSIGETERDVCIIPQSAHGTNPASAAMAGMKIAIVQCTQSGNLDLEHLAEVLEKHKGKVAAAMVTYPSTHGVFEASIKKLCDMIHESGGQVYLDGANMNAQVGLCRPGDYGADVVHLNLHKTFAIPHGGGGPGVGPICVKKHLIPFLPGHAVSPVDGREEGAVSSAPYGSALVCTISWMYITMLGEEGLRKATQVAILNANYVAKTFEDTFDVLYKGDGGFVAHECILDPRKHKAVSVADIAKRLMDYGFHAPTISFPVPGTIMVEPTESESKEELDRFCHAMKEIYKEICAIESGSYPEDDNPLVNAPHTAEMIASDDWKHPYSRRTAAFPIQTEQDEKYWPPVRRIDEVGGDRHLVCSCPPVEDYVEA